MTSVLDERGWMDGYERRWTQERVRGTSQLCRVRGWSVFLCLRLSLVGRKEGRKERSRGPSLLPPFVPPISPKSRPAPSRLARDESRSNCRSPRRGKEKSEGRREGGFMIMMVMDSTHQVISQLSTTISQHHALGANAAEAATRRLGRASASYRRALVPPERRTLLG